MRTQVCWHRVTLSVQGIPMRMGSSAIGVEAAHIGRCMEIIGATHANPPPHSKHAHRHNAAPPSVYKCVRVRARAVVHGAVCFGQCGGCLWKLRHSSGFLSSGSAHGPRLNPCSANSTDKQHCDLRGAQAAASTRLLCETRHNVHRTARRGGRLPWWSIVGKGCRRAARHRRRSWCSEWGSRQARPQTAVRHGHSRMLTIAHAASIGENDSTRMI
jgi:hypothetical protein